MTRSALEFLKVLVGLKLGALDPLRGEFARRYGVTHTRVEEAERGERPQYAAFFTGFGALSPSNNRGDKQVYLWRVSSEPACMQT